MSLRFDNETNNRVIKSRIFIDGTQVLDYNSDIGHGTEIAICVVEGRSFVYSEGSFPFFLNVKTADVNIHLRAFMTS